MSSTFTNRARTLSSVDEEGPDASISMVTTPPFRGEPVYQRVCDEDGRCANLTISSSRKTFFERYGVAVIALILFVILVITLVLNGVIYSRVIQ
jgi:hypothetical protein